LAPLYSKRPMDNFHLKHPHRLIVPDRAEWR